MRSSKDAVRSVILALLVGGFAIAPLTPAAAEEPFTADLEALRQSLLKYQDVTAIFRQ